MRNTGHWDNPDLVPRAMFDAMMAEGADVYEVEGNDAADDSSRGWFLELAVNSVYIGPRAIGVSRQQSAARDFVDLLLKSWSEGADLFAKTPRAGYLLVQAARQLHWPTVARLIAAQVDLEARADGLTTLHHAVRAKNEDVVVQLLQAGADVLAVTEDFKTPLALAKQAAWDDGVALLGKAAEVAVQQASRSGDGTVSSVGIRLTGAVRCADCSQKFDTRRAMEIHWKFIHDPSCCREE